MSSSCLATPHVSRAANRTKLTISNGAPQYQQVLTDLATEFRRESPEIEVDFVVAGDSWDPLLQNTLRGSLVGDLPDGTWQSLTYAPLLAKRGIAQPLTTQFGGSSEFEAMGLPKDMVEASMRGGQVFAMPFGTTVPIVYCNMDLLRRGGYSKTNAPGTWDEIAEVGAKVAVLGNPINGGYIAYPSTNAWMFQNLLASFGGQMMTADQREIAFDGPEGLRALEVLWQLGAASNIDMTHPQAINAFSAGSEGFLITSASATKAVSKAAAGSFDFQVGQFPVHGENGRLIGAGHGFMVFTKDPERQKALGQFMKLALSPTGQMILARNTGYMPVNILALKDAKFLEEYLSINPYHRAIVERLSITGDQFSFPSENTVKIVEMIAETMRQVVVHQAKPAQALASMADQTRKLIKT
nr:extracellular solute-binding protein [Chelatococcus asaccharovorans]